MANQKCSVEQLDYRPVAAHANGHHFLFQVVDRSDSANMLPKVFDEGPLQWISASCAPGIQFNVFTSKEHLRVIGRPGHRGDSAIRLIKVLDEGPFRWISASHANSVSSFNKWDGQSRKRMEFLVR